MIKDFIQQINLKLNELSDVNVRYKYTSLTDNYILFDIDIFDKSYARVDGQIVIDLRYSNIMELLNVQNKIIKLLDKWHYAKEETSASVYFVILNDLSSITDKQYWNELRFEFQLRWRDR
ncbi:hypothetical protein [Schnuerera sp.]|uniref:hypothetical protein n=1 Tax=Schnuerera sp. TaxID=2794844 RepID=UPI002C4D16C4|nr:hypothetical protein [Schnuerera sp.]HSH36083.1 hypothetical protein [Schnuerera sp.]